MLPHGGWFGPGLCGWGKRNDPQHPDGLYREPIAPEGLHTSPQCWANTSKHTSVTKWTNTSVFWQSELHSSQYLPRIHPASLPGWSIYYLRTSIKATLEDEDGACCRGEDSDEGETWSVAARPGDLSHRDFRELIASWEVLNTLQDQACTLCAEHPTKPHTPRCQDTICVLKMLW